MPSYKAVYSGDYLKAEDIYRKRLLVTIDTIMLKTIEEGKEPRLIVSFVGKDRQLILNKTNASTLGDLYGDDYDGWTGRAVVLFTVDNVYQGKPGIRIDPPPPGTVGATEPVPPPPPADTPFVAGDDDVPF